MAGEERNPVKRVLFPMIGATMLLIGATTATTSAADKLVVPVYKMPKDVVASVNAGKWDKR